LNTTALSQDIANRIRPMPRPIADRISLRYHVTLDRMRRGSDDAAVAQAMLEMLMAVGLLAGLGYGQISSDLTLHAERSLSAASRRGLDSKVWSLNESEFDTLCEIIAVYDMQLYCTPVDDFSRVFKEINALAKG
jgi:hypothetical protein